jgi:GntR family transcriptional regulator
MTIDIKISPGSAAPIYQQVIDQVRLSIASGSLQAGEQLPSVRGLAERLLVNPNTIARAYREMVRDGVLESRHGQGVFIAEQRRVFSDDERSRRVNQAIDALVSEAVALDFSAAEIRAAVDKRLKESGLSRSRKRS